MRWSLSSTDKFEREQAAWILFAFAAVAAGLFGYLWLTTKPKIVEVTKEVVREVPKEVVKVVTKEVPKEVVKEVIKEVTKEVIRDSPQTLETLDRLRINLNRLNKENDDLKRASFEGEVVGSSEVIGAFDKFLVKVNVDDELKESISESRATDKAELKLRAYNIPIVDAKSKVDKGWLMISFRGFWNDEKSICTYTITIRVESVATVSNANGQFFVLDASFDNFSTIGFAGKNKIRESLENVLDRKLDEFVNQYLKSKDSIKAKAKLKPR